MRRFIGAFLLLCLCWHCFASTTETYATNVDGAGTNLKWDRFTPGTGGPTWPAAICIHGGGYKGGNRGPGGVAQDMANAGFLAFAVEYRLAPPHTSMPGQVDPPSDGRPPEQTDDIQRAIRAARADTIQHQSNGKVVVLGFSCGGAHGAWWLISGTANDDRPDAVVSCSGTFDLDNSDFIADSHNLGDVQNYINHLLTEGTPFHNAAKAASPYWLTVSATPAPILIFNSDNETVSVSVPNNMVTKMTSAGGTVESHVRTGTEHASAYWDLSYGGSFSTVKDCSIDFLQRMLSIPETTPVPAQQILLRQ